VYDIIVRLQIVESRGPNLTISWRKFRFSSKRNMTSRLTLDQRVKPFINEVWS
jgi:hypothetical protein